jgi:hypothetical protein
VPNVQIAPGEPLSPELVLVLPPEERAQVIAALGPPVRPMPRFRVVPPPAPVDAPLPVPIGAPLPAPVEEQEPFGPSLARLVAARLVSLGVIFLVATILTLALSMVAHALRTP